MHQQFQPTNVQSANFLKYNLEFPALKHRLASKYMTIHSSSKGCERNERQEKRGARQASGLLRSTYRSPTAINRILCPRLELITWGFEG